MRMAVVLIAVTVACGLAVGEPVFVADFEGAEDGGPVGWSFERQRGDCSGEWDRAEPPPGGSSIRCDVTENAAARATWTCTRRIALKPDTAYRLSFRVMLGDVSEGSKGAYVILYENGEPSPDFWHMSRFMRGTQDRHEREISFITRPDASWGRLQCRLWECTGHAWFDDIAIEQIDRDEVRVQGAGAPLVLPEDEADQGRRLRQEDMLSCDELPAVFSR